MIQKMMLWVAKVSFGDKLVRGVAWLHDLLAGHRSEILMALTAVIHALQASGNLDPDTAKTAETALLGALPLTLAAKAAGVRDQVDSLLPKPPTTP